MRRAFAFAALALFFSTLACVHRKPAAEVYAPSPEEAPILEEILRLAIADARTNAGAIEVGFLEVGDGKDPSTGLLRKLAKETGLYLRPYSEARRVEYAFPGEGNHIPNGFWYQRMAWSSWDFQFCESTDPLCRKRGIVIDASVTRILDPDTAEVSFGWKWGLWAMAGVSGTLKRIDGKWTLLKEGQTRNMS